MARFSFTVNGLGGKSVTLPVSGDTEPFVLTGLETRSLRFEIQNTLTRSVSFTTVSVVIDGLAKDKVSAAVRFDNIQIEPGQTFENFLDVESQEELTEEDTFDITVSAEEV